MTDPNVQAIKARNYDRGTVVFEQGSETEDHLFFLFSGDIEITRHRHDGKHQIDHVHPGMFFGEVAVISQQAHHMTATVSSDQARVGIINRQTFIELCQARPDFLLNLLRHAIERLLRADDKLTRITQTLDSEKRREVEAERRHRPKINILDYVNSLFTRTHYRGEVIFKENQEADGKMYFVFEGELDVVRRVNNKDEVIGRVGPNDFFGEMALISNHPRAASIIVRPPSAKLGLLDHETFMKIARSNPPFLYEILRMVIARLVLTEHLIDMLVVDTHP